MEFRAAYPIARLAAHIGNVQGGISRKKSSKVNDSDPYEWEWFIPPYAAYVPMMERYSEPNPLDKVDPAALTELWEHRSELSPVLFMAVDWNGTVAKLGIDPQKL